jgi:membrane protein implicated in regulation of membrane protease activity
MRRRTNFAWGLVFLAVALVVLLQALQILPPGVYDLVLRAWPALLILAGLTVFLRSRVTFGAGIALILSLALAGGVTAYAFSTRATQQREDNQQPVEQAVSEEVTLLNLQVTTLTTDVELLRSLNPERVISGEYLGSSENSVEITYNENGASASLSLVEKQANPFPLLENIGRGALRIELPADLPLDVVVNGASGTVRLNMSGLAVERMNLNLNQGNALVTLPVYQPLGSSRETPLGTLAARGGDLTLFVPPEVAARFEIEGGSSEPTYDPTVYNALFDNTVLEARNIDVAEIVVRYNLSVPRGRVRLEVPE